MINRTTTHHVPVNATPAGPVPITTEYEYDFLLYSRSYILPYVPYNTTLGVLVLILDFMVASFYTGRLKDKSFVPGLYLVIALFDGVMVLGLYGMFVVLALLQKEGVQDTGSLWGLLLSKVIVEVSYRVSVFANTLLCVTRTMKTARPFRRINKNIALGSLAGYILFWIFIGISEVTLFVKKFLDISEVDPYASFGRVGGNICHNIVWGCEEAGIHCTQGLACSFILTLLLPLLVPCIVTITCLLVMLVYMRNPCPSSTARRHRYVTVTVTWLTVIFVACTSPSVLYYFVYVFIMLGLLGYRHGTPTHDFILENMCSSTLPLLGALFTQMLIVFRSKDLRSDISARLSRVSRVSTKRSLQSSGTTKKFREREQFL